MTAAEDRSFRALLIAAAGGSVLTAALYALTVPIGSLIWAGVAALLGGSVGGNLSLGFQEFAILILYAPLVALILGTALATVVALILGWRRRGWAVALPTAVICALVTFILPEFLAQLAVGAPSGEGTTIRSRTASYGLDTSINGAKTALGWLRLGLNMARFALCAAVAAWVLRRWRGGLGRA